MEHFIDKCPMNIDTDTCVRHRHVFQEKYSSLIDDNLKRKYIKEILIR